MVTQLICMLFQMPTGQGIQMTDTLHPNMFSKWLILQPVGATRNEALVPNPAEMVEYAALSQ